MLGCLALAVQVYRSAPPPDALRTGLALFVLICSLWMTQALHLLVPIFLGVAASLGLPPPLFAVGIAVSASCAFMLPVATPSNAIVYATERVPQATMMRCGLVLNLVCIAAITAVATLAFA